MRNRRLLTASVVASGCAGLGTAPGNPASPGTFPCALLELERIGYQITAHPGGSSWHQAYRERNGGEEIWIRLADDGRRAPWLEVRYANRDFSIHGPGSDGSPSRSWFLRYASHGEGQVGAVLDRCESRLPRAARTERP